MLILECFSPYGIYDTVISDNNGKYSFDSLPAGVYSLKTYNKNFIADTVHLVLESNQIIPFVLLNRSHVLDSVPDTLCKEDSPYLVYKYVRVAHPLVILPGVNILFFDGGEFRSNYGISAIGTEKDSIRFIVDSSSCSDTFYNHRTYIGFDNHAQLSNYKFTYCKFEGLNSIMIFNFSHLSFENNLFTKMNTALTFCMSNGIDVKISNNTIYRCIDGIRGFDDPYFNPSEPIYMQESFAINNNVISCSNLALALSATAMTYVNHNTCIGLTSIDLKKLSANDTVVNNIFSGINFNGQSATIPYIAFNAYDTLSGPLPPGVGKKVLTNGHGDSCDYFFNICTNPLITDSISGMIAKTSHCVGTASDGKNIGVYQGTLSSTTRDVMEKYSSVLLKIPNKKNPIFIPFDSKIISTMGAFTITIYSINGKRISGFDSQLTADRKKFVLSNDNQMVNLGCGKYIVRISNQNASFSFPCLIK
jgi:hypothetical protein